MIQIIVHAFIENGEAGIIEVLFASADHEKVQAKYEELTAQHPDHYLSVMIGKEEFE